MSTFAPEQCSDCGRPGIEVDNPENGLYHFRCPVGHHSWVMVGSAMDIANLLIESTLSDIRDE